MDDHSPAGITQPADSDGKRETLSGTLPEAEPALPQHDKPGDAVVRGVGEPLAGDGQRAAEELCQGRKRKRDDECGPQEAGHAETNHHMSVVHPMEAGTDCAPPLAEPSPPSPPGAPPPSQVDTPAATSVSPRPPTRPLSLQLPLPFPGAPQAVMMPPMFMPAMCQLLLVYIQRAQLLAAQAAGEQKSTPQQQRQLPEPPSQAQPPPPPPPAAPPPPPASSHAPAEGQTPPQQLQPSAQALSLPQKGDGGAKPLVNSVVPPAVVAVRQLQAFHVSAQLLLQASAHLMVVGALSPLDYQAIQAELGSPVLQLPFPMVPIAALGQGAAAAVGAAAVAVAAAEGRGAPAAQALAAGAPRVAARAENEPPTLSPPAAGPLGPGSAQPLPPAPSLAPAAVATITSALASRGSAGARLGTDPLATGPMAGTAAAAGPGATAAVQPVAGTAGPGPAPAPGQGPPPLGPSAAVAVATGARADGGGGGRTAAAAGVATGVGQSRNADASALASAPSWVGRGAGPSRQRLGLGRRLFKSIAEQLPTNAELDSIVPPLNGLFSGVMYKVQGSTEVGCAVWDGAELRDLGLYSTPQDARQSLSITIKLICAGAAVAVPAAPQRARPAAAMLTCSDKVEHQQQEQQQLQEEQRQQQEQQEQQPPAGVEPGADVVAPAAATATAEVVEMEAAAAAAGGISPEVGATGAGAGRVVLGTPPRVAEDTVGATGAAAGPGPAPTGPPVFPGAEADLMDAAEQLLLLRQELPRPEGPQEPQAQDSGGQGSGPAPGPAPAPAGPGAGGALPGQTQGPKSPPQQPSAAPWLTQHQHQQLQQWLSRQHGARLPRREEQAQLLQLLLQHQQQQQLAKSAGSHSAEQQRSIASAAQPPQPGGDSNPGPGRTTAAAAAAAAVPVAPAAQAPNGGVLEPGRPAVAIGVVEDVGAGTNVPAAPADTHPAPAGAGAAAAALDGGGGGGAAALAGRASPRVAAAACVTGVPLLDLAPGISLQGAGTVGGVDAGPSSSAGTATTAGAAPARVKAAGADAAAEVAGGMGPAAIAAVVAAAAGALQPAAATADGLPSASDTRHYVRKVRQPAETQGAGCTMGTAPPANRDLQEGTEGRLAPAVGRAGPQPGGPGRQMTDRDRASAFKQEAKAVDAEPGWRPRASAGGFIRVAASPTVAQPSTDGGGTAANTAPPPPPTVAQPSTDGGGTAATTAPPPPAAADTAASLGDGIAGDTRSGSESRPACAPGLPSLLDRETQLLQGLLQRGQLDREVLLSLLARPGGVSALLGAVQQQQQQRQNRQTGLDTVIDLGVHSASVVLEGAGSGLGNVTPRGWSGSGQPADYVGPRPSPPREAVAPRRRPEELAPEPRAVGTQQQQQQQRVLLLDRALPQEALLGLGLGLGPSEDAPPADFALPDRVLRLGEQHHLPPQPQQQQQEQHRLLQRLQRQQQQQQRQQHPQLMEAGSDSEASGRVLVLESSRAADLLAQEEEVLAAVIAGGGIQSLARSLAAQQAGARLMAAAAAASAGQSRAGSHQVLEYVRLGSGGGGVSANAISSNAHTAAQLSSRGPTLVLSGPTGADSAATSGMSRYGGSGPAAAAVMPREAYPSGRGQTATQMGISDDEGDGGAPLPLGPLHAPRQVLAAHGVRHSVAAAAAAGARSAASGRMSARELNLEVRGYGRQYTSHAAGATGRGSSDMDMGAGVYGSATVAAAEAAALLSSGLATSLPSYPGSYTRSSGLGQGYGHGHDAEHSIAYGRGLEVSLNDCMGPPPGRRRRGDGLAAAVGGVAAAAAGSDSSNSSGAVRAARSDAAEVEARGGGGGAELTRGIRQAGVSREYAAVTNLVGLGLQEALALVRQRQGGSL